MARCCSRGIRRSRMATGANFINETPGTLRKTGGTGASNVHGGYFENRGSVSVETGTLEFENIPLIESIGGTWSARHLVNDPLLLIHVPITSVITTANFDGSSVVDCDRFQVGRNSTANFAGGSTVDVDEFELSGIMDLGMASLTVGELTLRYGTLINGVARLTVTSQLYVEQCSISLLDPGYLEIASSATVSHPSTYTQLYFTNMRVDNHGVYSWWGNQGTVLNGSTVFNNYGHFQMSSNQSMQGTGSFVNHVGARFAKVGGGGTSTISVPFTNPGEVEAANGTLRLQNLTSLSGGDLSEGIYDVESILSVDGADVTTNSADVFLEGMGASFREPGGQSAFRNLASNAGTIGLRAGAALSTTGSLLNDGLLTFQDASVFGVSGGFTQSASGELRIELGPESPVAGCVQAGGAASFSGALTIEDAARLRHPRRRSLCPGDAREHRARVLRQRELSRPRARGGGTRLRGRRASSADRRLPCARGASGPG